MTALPPGVREETRKYIEDSARASLFPPEPIKFATSVSYESHEVAVSAPVSTSHTTGATTINTSGNGSDSSDIPF